jgi:hypothetical protein
MPRGVDHEKKSRLEGGSGVNREASNRVDVPLNPEDWMGAI